MVYGSLGWIGINFTPAISSCRVRTSMFALGKCSQCRVLRGFGVCLCLRRADRWGWAELMKDAGQCASPQHCAAHRHCLRARLKLHFLPLAIDLSAFLSLTLPSPSCALSLSHYLSLSLYRSPLSLSLSLYPSLQICLFTGMELALKLHH